MDGAEADGRKEFNEILKALIDTYRGNREVYEDPSYKEDQLRQEFLNPLLKTLGWDIDNSKGAYGEFREVVHEDRLSIKGRVKAPDYGIYLGSKRQFYVEAKAPHVNLNSDSTKEPAFQIRRYGWSATLPMCLLTNFKQVAVYDTRMKPHHNDKPSAARVIYGHIDEKGFEAAWGEVYDLFSHAAVERGSLARFEPVKGTTGLDASFLKDMEEWRENIAKDIYQNTQGKHDAKTLTWLTQQTINRIIFLRICEARGIEDGEHLQTIAKGNNVYQNLLRFFQEEADEKYNSGLFHFGKKTAGRATAPDVISPRIDIKDRVLKNIIPSLYYPQSSYEFGVFPPDILGSIYERFLGKEVVITKGGRAAVEDKPEIKKSGGVFYTPQYIVEYIVGRTVGEQLKDKTPAAIGNFRVVDPACGSGSFLLEAYEKLLQWYFGHYVKAPEANSKFLVKTGNDYKLRLSERKRILKTHIFGVDLDPQAVEVAKLSLLLKVTEGLVKSELSHPILPDLSENIKCGNSLIGNDFYVLGTAGMTPDEQLKINAFDWEEGFAGAFRDGGFDVIIGNPPYVSAPTMVEMMPLQREAIAASKRFTTLYQKWDLYVPFMELGLRMLKPDGFLSMIVPYPLTNQTYAKKLREFIMERYTLLEIADLSGTKVFGDAAVTNCIPVIQNDGRKRTVSIAVVRSNGGKSIHRGYKKSRADFMPDAKTAVWNLAPEKRDTKSHAGVPVLGDFCYISKGMVLNSDENARRGKFVKEDLISKKRDKLHPRKYIEAKDIERYRVKRVRYLEYNTPRCPGKLSRPTFRELYDCPKLVMNCLGDISIAIDQNEKYLHNHSIYCAVLWKDLRGVENKSISASVTRYSRKSRAEMEALSEEVDLRYLLGLLNSKYAAALLSGIRAGDYHIYPEHLRNFPLPALDLTNPRDEDRCDKLITLVDQMLTLKKREAAEPLLHPKTVLQRQIAALDKTIDNLVYELYGLTEEEIETVKTSASAEFYEGEE
ncbi:MAG: N-6 DNA methylase [Treponematales bacterium]